MYWFFSSIEEKIHLDSIAEQSILYLPQKTKLCSIDAY